MWRVKVPIWPFVSCWFCSMSIKRSKIHAPAFFCSDELSLAVVSLGDLHCSDFCVTCRFIEIRHLTFNLLQVHELPFLSVTLYKIICSLVAAPDPYSLDCHHCQTLLLLAEDLSQEQMVVCGDCSHKSERSFPSLHVTTDDDLNWVSERCSGQ